MKDRSDLDTLKTGLGAINDPSFSAIVGALDPAAQLELSRMCEIRTVKIGDVLIPDAERPGHLGFVLEGVMGMRKVLADGRTHIIGLLVPTDVYGRIFHRLATFQVEALTDGKVFCIARQPLEKFLLDHADIERHFLANALDELDALREWILLLGARKIATRVASLLVILGRRSLRKSSVAVPVGTAVRVNIPIRRVNLAEYLGTTVESLSRALRSLQHDGLIEMLDPYNFELLDLNGLMRLAGHVSPAAVAGSTPQA